MQIEIQSLPALPADLWEKAKVDLFLNCKLKCLWSFLIKYNLISCHIAVMLNGIKLPQRKSNETQMNVGSFNCCCDSYPVHTGTFWNLLHEHCTDGTVNSKTLKVPLTCPSRGNVWVTYGSHLKHLHEAKYLNYLKNL